MLRSFWIAPSMDSTRQKWSVYRFWRRQRDGVKITMVSLRLSKDKPTNINHSELLNLNGAIRCNSLQGKLSP